MKISSGRKQTDGMPIWVKEKRQPTKDELIAKHVADGGSVAYGQPEASGPMMESFKESETELVEIFPGTFVNQPKALPPVTTADEIRERMRKTK